MLLRFASATAVVSVALGFAALIALVIPGIPRERFTPILFLWCFLPVIWGLWAMLAPRSWVPGRLPLWGAMLGVPLGAVAMFILNLPERIFEIDAPVGSRALGLALIVVVYYLLWLLVRLSYRALAR